MRLTRLALPAALAAATLALATFAPPAFADDPTPTTIYPVSGDIVFSSPTSGSVTIDYLCPADDLVNTLGIDIYQDRGDDVREQASGSATTICDGDRHSVEVSLQQSSGDEIVPGVAKLHAVQGVADVTQDVVVVRNEPTAPTPTPGPTPTPTPTPDPTPSPDPTPTQPPAPVLAAVTLTTNASPETVIKGKKISVKGTIERDGKKFKAKTRLEFSPDGGHGYTKVASVTSSASGKLATTVKAGGSGSFRYVYAGSSTTRAATSSGDHIVVKAKPKPKPKAKTYANCAALNKVYPHGVGKSGAHDKTSSGKDPVTDFTRDSKTYAKNTKSDRDKDGIACERA